MEKMLKELEAIEKKHPEFFEKSSIRLYMYISISRQPVMLRFNTEQDNKHKLPKIIYDKLQVYINGLYGLN